MEAALRPPAFEDFTGQPKTIERLQVMVGAAAKREEALKHTLLCGPPGLGKTTLAHIIGHELKRDVRITSGPVIDKPGDLAGLLTNLQGRIFYLSMKFTGFPKQWRNTSIRQWRTTELIS